jgi:hypothetical protein
LTHGRGCVRLASWPKTRSVTVYFQCRRLANRTDDQAQHIAAIGIKGRRRIDGGSDQLGAQAKDRRVAMRDDTESVALI